MMMRHRVVMRAAPALFFAGVVSCERIQTPGVTVTDSAGVRITLTRPSEVVFAVVDPSPILSLGGRDASGATQFFRVQNVRLDRSERLWVADGYRGFELGA